MKTMDVLRSAMAEVDAYYKEHGIFQDKFSFGASLALIVIIIRETVQDRCEVPHGFTLFDWQSPLQLRKPEFLRGQPQDFLPRLVSERNLIQKNLQVL